MAKTKTVNQFSSLRNVPRFFRMIWQVSPRLTLWNIALRLLQSGIPLAMLYVGKEIIDLVVQAIEQPGIAEAIRTSGHPIWQWVGLEFALAVANSLLGRAITLSDSLLGDLVNNDSSVRIIRHAATLDLYQFEDATFYDKLERARTQTAGRTALMSMVLSQAQDIITVVFLAGGLIAFNPWLLLILVVAVIPSFIGETRFNRETYSLTRSWTPERRELDYLRYIGASNETAKEIKIFGLEGFIADRFKLISDKYYLANQKLALRRAAWGGFFSALGTASYYAAYVFIVGQTGPLAACRACCRAWSTGSQGSPKWRCTCKTCSIFWNSSPCRRRGPAAGRCRGLFARDFVLKMSDFSTPAATPGPCAT